MMEPTTLGAGPEVRTVEEEPEQRAFRLYFEQLIAVSRALSDLREAYPEPRWAVYFARSVDCAWEVLEALRAQLEFVSGNGTLSYPGWHYIRDRMREVVEEGWMRRVSRNPAESEALVKLAELLHRLEDRLTTT